MSKTLPLHVGTKVVAARNFGPVTTGQPGIITGVAQERYFLKSRPIYLCTFADNMKVAARAKDIDDHDHGYSLVDLEAPDFARVMAERTKVELAGRMQGRGPSA